MNLNFKKLALIVALITSLSANQVNALVLNPINALEILTFMTTGHYPYALAKEAALAKELGKEKKKGHLRTFRKFFAALKNFHSKPKMSKSDYKNLPPVVSFDFSRLPEAPEQVQEWFRKNLVRIPKAVVFLNDETIANEFITRIEGEQKAKEFHEKKEREKQQALANQTDEELPEEGPKPNNELPPRLFKPMTPGADFMAKFLILLRDSFFTRIDVQWGLTRKVASSTLKSQRTKEVIWNWNIEAARSSAVMNLSDHVKAILDKLDESETWRTEDFALEFMTKIISDIYFGNPELIGQTKIPELVRQIFKVSPINILGAIRLRKQLEAEIDKLIELIKDPEWGDQNNFVKQLKGTGISQKQLVDHLIGFFLAALDTTTTQIHLAMKLLAERPEVQELLLKQQGEFYAELHRKAQEAKIHQSTGNQETNSKPSKSKMPTTPIGHYLKNIVALFPSLPTISRLSNEDMEIEYTDANGDVQLVKIAANSIIVPSPWIQVRKRIAEQDQYEKYEDFQDIISTQGVQNHCVVNPKQSFGVGEHACIGGEAAMIILEQLFIGILNKYKITKNDRKKWNENWSVNFIHMVLEPPRDLSYRLIRR